MPVASSKSVPSSVIHIPFCNWCFNSTCSLFNWIFSPYLCNESFECFLHEFLPYVYSVCKPSSTRFFILLIIVSTIFNNNTYKDATTKENNLKINRTSCCTPSFLNTCYLLPSCNLRPSILFLLSMVLLLEFSQICALHVAVLLL